MEPVSRLPGHHAINSVHITPIRPETLEADPEFRSTEAGWEQRPISGWRTGG